MTISEVDGGGNVVYPKAGQTGMGVSVATLIGRFKKMEFLIHLTATWKDNIGDEIQEQFKGYISVKCQQLPSRPSVFLSYKVPLRALF